jgi:glutathione S-transferase
MSSHTQHGTVLFGLSYSVYTRIARLVLEEKGVRYRFQEVDVFASSGVPPEHLRRHPFGRIPVLEHDGFMLYETSAITRYVDETFRGPALQPAAPASRARMNQTISSLDAYAYRPMIWDIFVQRVSVPRSGGVPDEHAIQTALPVARTCLSVLAAQLAERHYLVGDSLSLADLHAAPMLMYLAATPEGTQLLKEHPMLQAWLRAMSARESVRSTQGKYG